MAYPAGIGPYGLLPINLEGGRAYAGAIRKIPLTSGYAQNIGYGDLVGIANTGTIVRIDTSFNATKSAFAIAPIGVFLGCNFTQNTGYKYPTFSQNWVSGTTFSGNGFAIVADDPLLVMKASITNAGTAYTSSAATIAAIGNNIGYFLPTTPVNAATGDSAMSLDYSTLATTATLPFRVVDVVRDTALNDGTFVELLVEYTAPTVSSTATVTQASASPYAVSAVTVTSTVTGGHFYRNPTGI